MLNWVASGFPIGQHEPPQQEPGFLLIITSAMAKENAKMYILGMHR